MTECPDPECRESLKDLVDGKLSVKHFIALSSAALIIIGIVTTVVVTSYSSGEEAQMDMIKLNSNRAHKIDNDVTAIKANQEHLHGRMKRLGEKLDVIQDVQQEVLRELIKINTQMEKNGNNHN